MYAGLPSSGPDAGCDVLDRLRLHAALPASSFELRFLAPVERLGMWLGGQPPRQTPAQAPDRTCSLRLCTEAGFYSFQAADGLIFAGRSGVQARHRLEVRWRYVCFAAGLLHLTHPAAEPDGGAWLLQIMGAQNLDWLDAGGQHLGTVLNRLLDVRAGAHAPHGCTPDSGVLEEGRVRVARLVLGVVHRLRLRAGGSAPDPCPGSAGTPAAPDEPPHAEHAALPPDLRARIRDPLQARRLVELVEACRARVGSGQALVARSADGLALALDFVVPIVHDLPRWTEAMAEAGLIHCPPGSPGRRMVPWVFTPGAEPRPAVFLSALACRRLGL